MATRLRTLILEVLHFLQDWCASPSNPVDRAGPVRDIITALRCCVAFLLRSIYSFQ